MAARSSLVFLLAALLVAGGCVLLYTQRTAQQGLAPTPSDLQRRSSSSTSCPSGFTGPNCDKACPGNCTKCNYASVPVEVFVCTECGNSLYLYTAQGSPRCVEASECACDPAFEGDKAACDATYTKVGTGTTGRVCQSRDDCPSNANPCAFGGVCNDVTYEESSRGYTCTCKQGFGGSNVPYCFDEYCDPNPCQNSGTCSNNGTNFNCQCHPAFTGRRCEINIDECLSNPCQNGFQCIDQNDINGYRCDCGVDFGGKNCEIVKPCSPNPCARGTCSYDPTATDKYKCTCPAGYTGKRCTEVLDPCASNPCQNQAACVAEQDFRYSCTCRLGWTGQNCESRGDCASNPCQNNANCQPRASGIGFDCLCIGAFYGTLCETPDACAAKPCESLATCHRNGSSHYCTCDRTDGVCVSDASTGNSKNKGAGLLSMPVIIGIAAAGCLLVLLMVYVLACRGGYKKKAVKRRNSKAPRTVTSFSNPGFQMPEEDTPGHYREPVFNNGYEPTLTGRRPIQNTAYEATPAGAGSSSGSYTGLDPARRAPMANNAYAPGGGVAASNAAVANFLDSKVGKRQPTGNAAYEAGAGPQGRQPMSNNTYATAANPNGRQPLANKAYQSPAELKANGRKPVANPAYATGAVADSSYLEMDEPATTAAVPAAGDESYLDMDVPASAVASGTSNKARGTAPAPTAGEENYLDMDTPDAGHKAAAAPAAGEENYLDMDIPATATKGPAPKKAAAVPAPGEENYLDFEEPSEGGQRAQPAASKASQPEADEDGEDYLDIGTQ